MTSASLIALAASAIVVWLFTRTRREYLPIALFLCTWLASDVAMLAFDAFVLAPLRQQLGLAIPWTGWALAAWNLYHAIWLVPPAALVATALVVCAGSTPWPAFAGWACALAAFVLIHPRTGNGSLQVARETVEIIATVAATGLLVGRQQGKAGLPTAAQSVLGIVLVIEAASLLGAHRLGPVPIHLVPFAVLFLGAGYHLLRHAVKAEVSEVKAEVAKLDASQGALKQDIGELRAQSNWTAEAATRTGRLVAKMAQNGKTPTPAKTVEVEVVDPTQPKKEAPTPSNTSKRQTPTAS